MAEQSAEPLTVAEAKYRLREAAAGPDAAELIRRHPYSSLALAFVAGAISENQKIVGRVAGSPYMLGWLARNLT